MRLLSRFTSYGRRSMVMTGRFKWDYNHPRVGVIGQVIRNMGNHVNADPNDKHAEGSTFRRRV